MHIVVDCRCVHRHMGGIGRAAVEMVRALGQATRGHRITMIVGSGHASRLPSGNVTVVTVDAAMIDEHFEQIYLPSMLEELKADLYLNTTFSVPAIRTTRRQLSIVHDVVFEDRPELVEPGLRSYLSRWSRFAASHADHVLTVSGHALERIRSVYGVESSRITRIYNGVSQDCFASPDERDLERVRAKFKIDRPFILYLGSIEIKKGVVELLRAFRRASESGLAETLVLAGGLGPGFDLDAHIKREGSAGRVRHLGFIDEGDKRPLLKASSLFVYPSLYEGFGIPPLEAMALGIPCIVSDQSALPEIVGNAAMTVPVHDAAEFAKALKRGVQDEEFRRVSAIKGPERAREYTWERSAAQLLDLCERLEAN